MEPEINPEFEILYEDDDCVAVNKSGNCPAHEGGLYHENTLTRLLEKRFNYRLYPVYRLDRETSGIIVFAKNRNAVKNIKIFNKEYLAVCTGRIRDNKFTISKPIGEVKGEYIKWKKAVRPEGKPAITHIKVVKRYEDRTLALIKTETGRQHQIRVHMQSVKHPIMNDKIYGKTDKIFKEYLEGRNVKTRQALHLHKIILKNKTIISEMPGDMKKLTDTA